MISSIISIVVINNQAHSYDSSIAIYTFAQELSNFSKYIL